MSEAADSQRLDKWLWHARFFKTRTLAAKAVAQGVRVNGARRAKASASVRPGDVLTFAQGASVRVIEVAALGVRRGPAEEARALYLDRDPPEARPRPTAAPHPAAEAPAPDRRARRAIARLRRSDT